MDRSVDLEEGDEVDFELATNELNGKLCASRLRLRHSMSAPSSSSAHRGGGGGRGGGMAGAGRGTAALPTGPAPPPPIDALLRGSTFSYEEDREHEFKSLENARDIQVSG
jgi:hypothetical protein